VLRAEIKVQDAPLKPLLDKLVFTLLVSLIGLCGCVHEYLMKLSDGDHIISLSKPKVQGTYYLFTDQKGTGYVIPRSRVVKIQAVSVVKKEEKPMAPTQPKKPKHWYFLWLA
jgi:hypothetical protein